MMEHLYYTFMWLSGAVIFQAIVHFTLKRRKREEARLEQQHHHHRISSHNSLPEMDAASAESLDGDEPPVFFELLSQTGSEMMMVRSREKKDTPQKKFGQEK